MMGLSYTDLETKATLSVTKNEKWKKNNMDVIPVTITIKSFYNILSIPAFCYVWNRFTMLTHIAFLIKAIIK